VKAVGRVEKKWNAFGLRQTPVHDSSTNLQAIEGKHFAESHRSWCKADEDRSISPFFAAFHRHFDRLFRQISGKLISHRWLLRKWVSSPKSQVSGWNLNASVKPFPET
jgi:hypothetical protein